LAAVFAATTRWPTKAEVESMAAISFVGRFRFSGRVRLARVRLCVPGWAIQQPCSKPPPVWQSSGFRHVSDCDLIGWPGKSEKTQIEVGDSSTSELFARTFEA